MEVKYLSSERSSSDVICRLQEIRARMLDDAIDGYGVRSSLRSLLRRQKHVALTREPGDVIFF